MKPRLTNQAKKLLIKKGGKKLKIRSVEDKHLMPFDSMEIVRVANREFMITLYNNRFPVFTWDDMPPINTGDTICISGLTHCAIEFTLK